MCKDGKAEFIACNVFTCKQGADLFEDLEGVFGKGKVSGYTVPVIWRYNGDVKGVVTKDKGKIGFWPITFPVQPVP